jgi:hypothetical protein
MNLVSAKSSEADETTRSELRFSEMLSYSVPASEVHDDYLVSHAYQGLSLCYCPISSIETRPAWSDGQRPDAVRADGLAPTRYISCAAIGPRART